MLEMKVLVAPDKFKGSLTAGEAAQAIAEGWLRSRPGDEVVCVPISDGGEGFAEICGSACGAKAESVRASGPLGEPVDAVCFRSAKGVFFETASACGLSLIPVARRNPVDTTTRGVGEVLKHLATSGDGPVWVGLGGSGTTDGGFGMAVALGYRFLDASGGDLPVRPLELIRLARIVPPATRVRPEIVAGVDVANVLLGPEGCARRFGFQKGMREADVPAFEDALANLAAVVRRDLGRCAAETPGSGAAGGLGYGLAVFCGADLVPGFELASELIGLPALIAGADIVVTGEGALDSQSLSGKAPVALARLAASLGKPVLCAAGFIDRDVEWAPLFAGTASLVECAGSRAAALAEASLWLKEAASRLAAG
jgi:glycerate 2-kinase